MIMNTAKRREMTSAIASQEKVVSETKKFSKNINSAYGMKVEEDTTNREMFLSINSQLTGLAFEYKYLTGYYHPQLEEQQYDYVFTVDLINFVDKTFWDSKLVRDAANLEEGNEFHKNINEDTTEIYPEKPLKYSRWVNDSHSDVSIWNLTEQEIIDTIRTLQAMKITGGSLGNNEITIYGEYNKYIPDIREDKQKYMTVGYSEYISGSGGFMSDGYNPNNSLIIINKEDPNNFAFGKIINSKIQPSRILFVEYFLVGSIPENSRVTSEILIEDSFIDIITKELISQFDLALKSTKRYLNNNPTNNLESNIEALDNVNTSIELIKDYFNNDIEITSLVDSLEQIRNSFKEARIQFINDFLSNNPELYRDREKVLDMRLSKRMGTCREYMKTLDRIGSINKIANEKSEQIGWMKKFFTSRACERDGDWKRRVFIIDPDNDFKVGDEVYILTDNPEVKEIKATIDVIIDARLNDEKLTTYDEETDTTNKVYYDVKKIFFKNCWLDGKVKYKRFFPNTYKTEEGFRIIKQEN